MSTQSLMHLRDASRAGRPHGIASICSAHDLVIDAALRQAAGSGEEVLIEATCNQVNQDGGYTGMTPADFRDFVFNIADRVRFPRSRIILGGDHLGPNPWKHLPAEDAFAKASAMIAAYAAAGFEKLHLDTSMGCLGEPAHLPDDIVAERAARLAAQAETAATAKPVYVVGTEVPTPGGATDAMDHLTPTGQAAVARTFAVHEAAFRASAPEAWSRVIAIVVQPGVEFSHDAVAVYQPDKATTLAASLREMPGLVFEAHSTDYQPESALARLVRDGFSILKVGPALTFALREALYGLDAIDHFLHPEFRSLGGTMEALMLANPQHWTSHYGGSPAQQRLLRHFSYSDRIRYYWSFLEAQAATSALFTRLSAAPIPAPLVSQYLPRLYERVASGDLPAEPRALALQSVRDVLEIYTRATARIEP